MRFLEEEQEALLQDCIRQFYLTRERPSLAVFMREVKRRFCEHHTGHGEKQHDDDEDGNDRPRQLNLGAAVDLRRLLRSVRVRRAIAITKDRIEQKPTHEQEDAQRTAEHQHGQAEDGMRGRALRRENAGGPLVASNNG